MDKIPAFLRKPIFEKLFNIAEYTNLTKEEKEIYVTGLKYKWDNKNVLDYARNEIKFEEAREIASELKEEGLAIEFIAKTIKRSIEEIEKL